MPPITQYSKIKVRRGLTDDLPTLDGSELGHAIDQRRLFIGNGDISAGAPTTGNTEILTEFSNNAELIKHSYKSNTGVNAITGPTADDPVIRTLQEVLDDRLSIKSYGALGDGNIDDSLSINRALEDIYTFILPSGAQEQEYRAIYFPAGVYNLDLSEIKLPPYSILVGDGIGKTVINMIDSDDNRSCVVQTVDSLYQTDSEMGDNGAILPTNITVIGISFIHNSDKNVINLNRASNVLFEKCRFENSWVSGSSNSSLIYLDPIGGLYQHSNIKFRDCEFAGGGYIANLDVSGIDARDIQFISCRFLGSYYGFNLDNASGDSIDTFKVIDSTFENVVRTCVYAGQYSKHVNSVNNNFRNCGSASYPVINFDSSEECSSLSDTFDLQVGVVAVINSSKSCLVLNPDTSFIHKNVVRTSKATPFTIQPGQTNTPTNISFDVNETDSMFIDYTLRRSGFSRIGRISVVTDGTNTGTSIADLFNESDTTGITFNYSISGSTLTVTYTSIAVIALGTVEDPSVTIGDTLTINGITVTFTGTTLNSVLNDIDDAVIPYLEGYADEDRLALFLSSGLTITISGTGTAMSDLGLVASYSSSSAQFHHQIKSWSML